MTIERGDKRQAPDVRWWPHSRETPSATMRLFCFPFSGGSAASYCQWHNLLPSSIALFPVELPGRAQRLLEPGFQCFDDAVSALISEMLPLTTGSFSLFGHSMGAFLAFELACKLQAGYGRCPVNLFVSGAPSPTVLRESDRRSTMSDLELIAELRRLKGTPPEVLTNPELLALVLPIVRSDFGLTETYRYRGSDKVQCPVLAFGGWSDPEASPSEVDRWRDVTSGPFDCNLFIGDHFFFHRWSARIASIIAGNVNNTIMPT